MDGPAICPSCGRRGRRGSPRLGDVTVEVGYLCRACGLAWTAVYEWVENTQLEVADE